MMALAIGIDIGGTKMSAGVIGSRGLVDGSVITEDTPAFTGPETIVALAVEMVNSLEGVGDASLAVGVGSAGVIGADGSILSATNSIRGWQGFGLGPSMMKELGRPVRVINDVHAAALGEARLGIGKSLESFLMVTVGTGVGGAIYRNGQFLAGVSGTAGSLGHTAARNQLPRVCTCGQAGHIEAYASGPAIELAYADATGRKSRLKEIAALAAGGEHLGGDVVACEVIHSAAAILGVGLADAMNLEDLDAVVIGGGVASIGELYLEAVRAAYAAAALPGPSRAAIHRATLGPLATVAGAGLYALQE